MGDRMGLTQQKRESKLPMPWLVIKYGQSRMQITGSQEGTVWLDARDKMRPRFKGKVGRRKVWNILYVGAWTCLRRRTWTVSFHLTFTVSGNTVRNERVSSCLSASRIQSEGRCFLICKLGGFYAEILSLYR